jgi:hypothetical protein
MKRGLIHLEAKPRWRFQATDRVVEEWLTDKLETQRECDIEQDLVDQEWLAVRHVARKTLEA